MFVILHFPNNENITSKLSLPSNSRKDKLCGFRLNYMYKCEEDIQTQTTAAHERQVYCLDI